MTRSPRAVRALVVLAVLAAAAPPLARAADTCHVPVLSAPGAAQRNGMLYAQGSRVDLAWTSGLNGGYRVETSLDPAFPPEATASANVAPSTTTHTVQGLDERLYYHRVRSRTVNQVCVLASQPWSNVLTVVQDATPPEVAFTTEPEDLCGVPVAPPQPVFCIQDEVRLEGTAVDPPGPGAPSASGAKQVIVQIVNTTPLLGQDDEPIISTVDVDPADDSWVVELAGDDKPSTGTYSVLAQAQDAVGNLAEEPEQLGIIIIL